ncbi:MAG: amino acid ABC transporter permease [Deltaproteobacteria bacterium]|nr:amino acid ABC transporter permease [Deltaproteobacteria bacterium]MBW2072360.1 amino acid ABC transporter permease [Deltaproteobacteria bacterium]
MRFDFQAIIDALPYMSMGLKNTLLLTFWGIVFSSILGIVCAILRISKNRLCRNALIAYIEIFRNTPIVAQIFYLYFALPLIGIKVSAFNCGLIALVLHFNAYNIEVFRSGLEAVPFGLHEAGEALGFTYVQRLRLITIPLALRICLPSLANNYVSLLKNTALVSIIGVVEITFVAQDVIADNFTFLEMYSTIAVLYLVLVFGLTWLLRKVERRYAITL